MLASLIDRYGSMELPIPGGVVGVAIDRPLLMRKQPGVSRVDLVVEIPAEHGRVPAEGGDPLLEVGFFFGAVGQVMLGAVGAVHCLSDEDILQRERDLDFITVGSVELGGGALTV
jgi:hypothetical protein